MTDGFLYVESIYIQANEARMPQVKKVVLAMGDRLIYRDTFQRGPGRVNWHSRRCPSRLLPQLHPVLPQLRRPPDKTHPRSPNASAVFGNRLNNWPGSLRR